MAEHENHLDQLVGEYRLLRQLGKGSFGVVYLAEHLHHHSQAAVKLLRSHLTDPQDFKAFLKEARMIRLCHPHIVLLLDFGLMRDNTAYLVMEYAQGGTLRQHCSKGTKLPYEMLDRYLRQLASALQYAHDHRVIHRDVKPENVLLRADGTLLLSDFGIAKVLEQSSLMSMPTPGTPAYMAPEQSRGRPCPASDQYALAVMAYEWLAGRLPFQGAALEMMLQHRVDEPPSLLKFSPEVPVQVEQVVMQALAKTPEERFSTIEQFAEALHAALQIPSATHGTTPPRDELERSSPNIMVSQPLIPSSPPHEPRMTHDPVNLSASSLVSSPQAIDVERLSESSFHAPSAAEIPATPLLGKQPSESQVQRIRAGGTQDTPDSLPVELSSQSSSAGDGPPITQNSPTGTSQPFPGHDETIIPRARNKRFMARLLVIPFVCLILLVSLLGGGAWIFLRQQYLFIPSPAPATGSDFSHATATVAVTNTAVATSVASAPATPKSIAPPNAATPTPTVLQTTTIDDSVMGTGLNQFTYVGRGWIHRRLACPGSDDCGNIPPYDDTQSVDSTANDFVTLTFSGVQIKFYGVVNVTYGIGALSIDGGTQTMVDFYASTHEGNQLLWTSPTLPAGMHTFKLRVTGSKDPKASGSGAPIAVDRVDILG